MDQFMDEKFKTVVQHVFNNWTALQLAVEHNMGGPTSHQTAVEAMNWVCSYCLSQSNLQVPDLTEVLEDILDEEFSTICEDDSPKDVAQVLNGFLQLLKQGNIEQFDSEFTKLPTCKIWLSKPHEATAKVHRATTEDESEKSSETEQDMDVDPGWTTVQRRK